MGRIYQSVIPLASASFWVLGTESKTVIEMEEILDCASCHKDYPTDGRRIHELLCPSIISAGSPPADNNYILGILFRQDSPSAEAVWVKCTKSADDETSISFQNVDVAPFFHGDTAPDAIYTERNPRRKSRRRSRSR